MTNQFTVLNTALSSLQSHQKALDTAGHNVSNANTEGYSRQRAEKAATRPYTRTARNQPADAGQIGTGVEVESINRQRDQFIDGQIREQNQASGLWEKRSEGLERIELIFNEPSENNLDQALNDFRNSLQELSNNPENDAVREEVRQRGETLADTFNTLHRQLTDYQSSLNDDVGSIVDEINSSFDRIADLNREIVHAESSGQDANDLRDQRDLLLDELNEQVDISASEDPEGNVNVNLGGVNVVSGTTVNELEVEEDDAGLEDEIRHSHVDREASIGSGELAGIMDVRDEEVPSYIDELNQMADTLTEEFNDRHETGFTAELERGGDFFTVDTGPDDEAQAISLTDNIQDSVENIAAGNYSDNPGVARLAVGEDATDLDDIEEDFDQDYDYSIDVIELGEESAEFRFAEQYQGETVHEYRVEAERVDGEFEFTVDGEEIDSDDYSVENLEDISTEDLFEASNEELENDFNFGLHDTGEANISFDPSAGSGSNAGLLSDVIDETEFEDLDGSTIKDHFEGVISSLGVDGQRADRMVENNEQLSEQLENQRESISGVSLDEEMANMVKYQQGYAAAANIITTTQQNLDTLMGIVR